MTELSVAVVGLGSRGVGVLERIVTLARSAGHAVDSIRVELVDPWCRGAGLHSPDQPDYLLLNTVCSEISMFPGPASVGDSVGEAGPSLHEWIVQRGLRFGPADFVPRRLLGEYLEWCVERFLRHRPEHVQVNTHRASAVDLSCDSGGVSLVLSSGETVRTDFAFLTTGHTPNQERPAVDGWIAEPYPLPGRLAEIRARQTVAVVGFGLTAMDVLAALTVGRGGRFVEGGSDWRYVPSGTEPRIVLLSRSGVPYRARPVLNRGGVRHRPSLFTTSAIDRLRAERGGPLDLDADLLPLVWSELRYAYGDDATFSLDRLWDGSGGMELTDASGYQSWLVETVRSDLAEAVRGLGHSRIKAALEMLRDLRDVFRYAVDFGGLDDTSLDAFHSRIVPLLNRAVIGPQKERHFELLALVSAGLVRAPFGPAPVVEQGSRQGWTIRSTRLERPYVEEVDWVCYAHTSSPTVDASASPLIDRLYRKGSVRCHRPGSRHVRGIDVDPDLHPVDANGQSNPRVWVLGPLCEGATFYNHLVPSPGGYCRPSADAHRCVAAMFAGVRAAVEVA